MAGQPAGQLSAGDVGGSQGPIEDLDPANRSLAEALRKSFRILKLLMLVLLVLYFLSGVFRVKQGEAGLILRYGRVVGTGEGQGVSAAVLPPRWYWSWPYPFERWMTVSTIEREMPVEFLFRRSDAEKATGIAGYKYDNLSPERDDYLITGDVNIIHASVLVKYRISDPVAFVTNVHPMPDPSADVRSAPHRRRPEYTILTHLVRSAVIETAAAREALDIRGEEQDAFLAAIGRRLAKRLEALTSGGAPLGISVDPLAGVIAPKKEGVEAIMPPRQTQEVFDQVQAAGSKKSSTITKARSEAQGLLVSTAGPEHERIAQAIEKEFDLMRTVSATDRTGASGAPPEEAPRLDAELQRQRALVEDLLTRAATGTVRAVLQEAVIARDRIIKEAAGDYERFSALLPEYLRDPGIFMSRLLDETYAQALDSSQVQKVYIPRGSKEVRLHIPRSSKAGMGTDDDEAKRRGGVPGAEAR